MEEDDRSERPARMFALAGATWTTVFSLAFGWEMTAALEGRDAFVRRFEGGGLARIVLELAIVLLAGAAWVGLAGKLRSEAPAVQGHRRLQWTAGALALAFVVHHAWRFWLPAALGADGGTVYELIRNASPQYVTIAIYAVGLAALALAWEQSLLVLVGTWGFVRRERTMRWYRVAAIALPVVVFVVDINAVGHFVTGRGLLWRPDPTEAASDDDAENGEGGEGAANGEPGEATEAPSETEPAAPAAEPSGGSSDEAPEAAP